jgi:hypothetical protein
MGTVPSYEDLATEVEGLKKQVNYLLERDRLKDEELQKHKQQIRDLQLLLPSLVMRANDADIGAENWRDALRLANERLRDNQLEPVPEPV